MSDDEERLGQVADEELAHLLHFGSERTGSGLLNRILSDPEARRRLIEFQVRERIDQLEWVLDPSGGAPDCWRPAELDRLKSDLAAGEPLIAVVGPSGFGKTHLLSALNYHLARSGRHVITLNRCSMWRAGELERRVRRYIESLEISTSPVRRPILLLDDVEVTRPVGAVVETILRDYSGLQIVYCASSTLQTTDKHNTVALGKLPLGVALGLLGTLIRKHSDLSTSAIRLGVTRAGYAKLIGMPFVLSLAVSSFSQFSPEVVERQLQNDSREQTASPQIGDERVQLDALTRLCLSNLGTQEQCCLMALIACGGPVDPLFLDHLLSENAETQHLVSALVKLRLLTRLGNRVEVPPMVRKVLQSECRSDRMKIFEANGVFAHACACRHFAEQVKEHSLNGRWSEAWTVFERYEHEFRLASDRAISGGLDHEVRSLSLSLSLLLFESEEYESLDKILEASISSADRLKDRDFRQRMLGLKGARQLRCGRVDHARQIWEERLTIGMGLADPECAIDASVDLASLEYEVGNHLQASNHLRAAEELARSHQAFELLASVFMIRAHLFMRDKDPVAARDCLKQAESLRLEFQKRDLALYVHQSRCSLLLQLGEIERAKELLIELLGNAYEGQRKVMISWCLRQLAEIEEHAGQFNEAKSQLCAAVAVHGPGYSRHKQIGIMRLGLLLGTDSKEEIGAALDEEAAPWQSTVEALLLRD